LEKFKCIVVVVVVVVVVAFFLLGEGLGLALRFVLNKTDEDERVIGLKTLGWSIVGVVGDELFVIIIIYYIYIAKLPFFVCVCVVARV
jgi:hypothetical protein